LTAVAAAAKLAFGDLASAAEYCQFAPPAAPLIPSAARALPAVRGRCHTGVYSTGGAGIFAGQSAVIRPPCAPLHLDANHAVL